MLCFALDTASAQPSFSFIQVENEKTLCTEALPAGRGQSADLLKLLEQAMQGKNISYSDISTLAVLTGPGSFTGLRVGMSFMKGLALSLKLPLYGCQHFELMAQTMCHGEKKVGLIALESGRKEKFFQFTNGQNLIDDPINCSIEELVATKQDLYLKSGYYVSDFEIDTELSKKPFAKKTSEYLGQYCLNNNDMLSTPLVPYYIRPADTSTPKTKID